MVGGGVTAVQATRRHLAGGRPRPPPRSAYRYGAPGDPRRLTIPARDAPSDEADGAPPRHQPT
jgi:hypothetical protein